MSEMEVKTTTVTTTVTTSADEAPTTAPPAIPDEGVEASKDATAGAVDTNEDIPAVDATGKEEGSKNAGEANGKEEKKPEPPKDPREDPLRWVGSLFPAAVHKVNYKVLEWAQELAVEEEDKRQTLPGKNDAVTKNQFLGFLRDGALLAKLANRLQPGAIEVVNEGDSAKEKSKQTSNINAFINFVKEKAELTDEQVFTTEDLQDKGKAGYQAVMNTLMQLGFKAQEKFEQKGIDADQLVQAASQAVQTNLIQTILNFFRRARPTQSPKQLAKEAEEKEKAEKAAAAEKVVEEKAAVVEEECKKVEVPAAVESAAIAAN